MDENDLANCIGIIFAILFFLLIRFACKEIGK